MRITTNMERRNMITITEYADVLGGLKEIVHEQTAGLSDDELLIQPPHGGNCMAWVLGHLANNLVTIQQRCSVGRCQLVCPISADLAMVLSQFWVKKKGCLRLKCS